MKRITFLLGVFFWVFAATGQSFQMDPQDYEKLTQTRQAQFEAKEAFTQSFKSKPVPRQKDVVVDYTRGLTYGGEINVIIVSPDTDGSESLRAALDGYEFINATSYPQANLPALTLEALTPYDVLITFNNNQWLAAGGISPDAAGDIFAAYIDQGGTVIENSYIMDFPGSAWAFGGDYISGNYSAFTQATVDIQGSFSLGTILEEGHPLLTGVSTLEITSSLIQDNQVAEDATGIVQWSNGEIFVAAKSNVVSMNMLPVAEGALNFTGDGVTLYANAVVWLMLNQADPASPAAPTNLTATAADLGALEASLGWDNPSVTFEGEPLTALNQVRLYRNGELIETFADPVIGASVAYTDDAITEAGIINYTVYGVNDAGEGPSASVTVYVGEDVPAAPSNVVLVADGNNGSVSWDAPTTGLNGGYLSDGAITYSLVRLPDMVLVAEDISATTFEDTTIPEIGNYQYAVTASNLVGEGGTGLSNAVLLGAGAFLLFEGFEDGWPPLGWTNNGWELSTWGSPNSGEEFAYSNLAATTLTTPAINIPTEGVYEFSFFLRAESANYPQSLNINISVDGSEFTTLLAFAEYTVANYEEITIGLEDYAGQAIQFQFENLVGTGGWDFGVLIDDVSIYEIYENDLAAVSISGNTTPSEGVESVYTVSVTNVGFATQTNYSVKLMQEGDIELSSVDGTSIEYGETVAFQLPWTPEPGSDGSTFIYGLVELIDDENTANNQTPNFNVVVQPGDIVAVTIGDGELLTTQPYNMGWDYSLQQTLYYPEEIGMGGGVITGIQYVNSFNEDWPQRDIQIWLGETDMEDLSEGWVDPATLQLVFDGKVDFPEGVNNIFIPLDEIYVYGGGNLVVYNYKMDDVYSFSKNFFNTDDPESNRTRRAQQDNNPYDPANPPAGTLASSFPNITMFFSTAGMGALEGVVEDTEENPLEGVTLLIEGTSNSTVSNEDGEFVFPFLPEGEHTLLASKTGYEDASQTFTIVEDETTSISLTMTALPTVSLSGLVESDTDPGLGVEGATVTLSGYADFSAMTNEDGEFTIEEVFADQTYTIEIVYPSHIPYEDEIMVGDVDLDLGTIVLEYTPIFGVAIGDGTKGVLQPIDFYYHHSITQTLYYPEEIGVGGGIISAIQYEYSFTEAQMDKQVSIWMGETTENDLTGGWVDPSSLTPVFSGTLDFPQGSHTILIDLDDIYLYGGGNLVIYVHKEDDVWVNNQFFMNTEDPESSRTRKARRDNTPIDPANPDVAGTVNHDFPNIILFVSTEGLGGLAGTVTDGEEPLEGVLVSVLGTNSSTHTDADGNYEFPALFPETYNVEFSKFGYETTVAEGVVVEADETTVQDATLIAIPQFTVNGVVEGNDGILQEGAVVTLQGYDDYTAVTMADGSFEIEDVFEGTYSLTVQAEGYDLYVDENVSIVDDTDLGIITLVETILLPGGLSIDIDGQDEGNALLSWVLGEMEEFRYDDGIVDGQLGFPEGNINSAMGSVHHRSAEIHEVSWFLTDEAGPHSTVKVWVLGLNADGTPDRNNVLYENPAVPNVHMEWNTYELSEPVNADGFFIGLSASSFLGLAIDDGVGEPWDFVPGTQFGVFDITDPTSAFTDISFWEFEVNYLLRGYGFDYGPVSFDKGNASTQNIANGPRPVMIKNDRPYDSGEPMIAAANANKAFTGFNVFLDDVEVASAITDTEYLFTGLEEGSYTAGVQSVYTTGNSDIVTLDFEIVFGVPVTFTVETNSGDSPEGAHVMFTNQDHSQYTYEHTVGADGVAHFESVRKGMYTLHITHDLFHDYIVEDINIQDEFAYTATLVEIITAPYGLMVETEGLPEGDAHFSWNNAMGDTYFFDSFEDGTFDAWHEFIQGAGTPGEGGMAYWHTQDYEEAPDGTKIARADWGYNIDTWLISPLMSVDANTSITFNWASSYFWSVDPNPNAQLMIKVSEDGGSTWDELWNWQEIGEWTNWVWYETTVDLDDYAGSSVHVAIQLLANDNAETMIDAITIGTERGQAGTIALSHPIESAFDLRSAPNGLKISKAHTGYNVFLNDVEVASGVTDTDYMFTNLPAGTHTAGVQSVYTSGVSETMTIEFEIVITEPETYTLTLEANPADGGTVSGDGEYEEGTEVTVTAVPADGFEFINWTSADDNVVSTEASFVYTMPAANTLLTANFEEEVIPVFPVTFTVTDETESYEALRIKGSMTDPAWMDIPLVAGDNHVWTVTLDVAPGVDYEWGITEDDGTEFGEWLLPPGDNLKFSVSEDGTVTGVVSFTLETDDTSINDLLLNGITMFPNPVKDVVTLRSDITMQQIRILDLSGRVVYNNILTADEYQINVRGFESGIYFVQILTSEGLFNGKLQIQE